VPKRSSQEAGVTDAMERRNLAPANRHMPNAKVNIAGNGNAFSGSPATARHMRAAPSAGILLLQKLCQHGDNESKRKRAHNEMHDQPPLVQVRVVAHHFGFLRDSREILRQTRAARLPSATT
jgi:hypothetical protein